VHAALIVLTHEITALLKNALLCMLRMCTQANSSGGSGISGEQLIDRVVSEMMGQGWLLCFDEFQVRTCYNYQK
jgi:predicted ATPase